MSKFREAMKADDDAPGVMLVDHPRYGTVEVRELTAAQFEDFLDIVQEGFDEDDDKRRRVRVAAMVFAATFDPETGKRVFDKADIEWLKDRPLRQLAPLYDPANKLNQVEDPKKFSRTIGDDSSEGSPAGQESPSES